MHAKDFAKQVLENTSHTVQVIRGRYHCKYCRTSALVSNALQWLQSSCRLKPSATSKASRVVFQDQVHLAIAQVLNCCTGEQPEVAATDSGMHLLLPLVASVAGSWTTQAPGTPEEDVFGYDALGLDDSGGTTTPPSPPSAPAPSPPHFNTPPTALQGFHFIDHDHHSIVPEYGSEGAMLMQGGKDTKRSREEQGSQEEAPPQPPKPARLSQYYQAFSASHPNQQAAIAANTMPTYVQQVAHEHQQATNDWRVTQGHCKSQPRTNNP